MNEIKWELIGKITASNYKTRILKELNKKEQTPKALSKELKINITHVSSNLTWLVKEGLIKCLTPNLRKGKIYSITEKGKKVLEKI